MMQESSNWKRAAAFHGHVCPGLALGFRAAQAGMAALNALRAEDEEIFAVVENDACGVDAVMVLTGCTLGKGNLLYRDLGKQAYVFGSRKTGRAVRVVVKNQIWRGDEGYSELAARVMGGRATPEEKERFNRMKDEKMRELLEMPAEELLEISEVQFPFPERARIFRSVQCAECGEWAMEPRMRLRNGQPVCLSCAGEYTRGW